MLQFANLQFGHHEVVNFCGRYKETFEMVDDSLIGNILNKKDPSSIEQFSNKLQNFDLMAWKLVLFQFYKELNNFVVTTLNSTLIVLTPAYIDNKVMAYPYNIIHGFEFQSLVKEICLLHQIPIVDIWQLCKTIYIFFSLSVNPEITN